MPFRFFLFAILMFVLCVPDYKAHAQNNNNQNMFSGFMRQNQEDDREAPAINQYSKKFKKDFSSTKGAGRGLIAQENFELYFVNTGASDDAVILRITAPSSVSGCAIVKQPSYEATEQGNMLWIKIDSPGVELKQDPRYSQFDCAQQNQSVSVDIPLSRARLESTPIRKIALRSANNTDYYTVEIANERLRLLPESQKAFKPRKMPDGSDALTHWFYPENTVVLFMPGAETGSDFTQEIQQLAATQGLVPLSSMIRGFQDNRKEPNTLYFVDPSGHYARNMNTGTSSVYFGRITAEREIYGSQGRQKKAERLDVYARTPYLPG